MKSYSHHLTKTTVEKRWIKASFLSIFFYQQEKLLLPPNKDNGRKKVIKSIFFFKHLFFTDMRSYSHHVTKTMVEKRWIKAFFKSKVKKNKTDMRSYSHHLTKTMVEKRWIKASLAWIKMSIKEDDKTFHSSGLWLPELVPLHRLKWQLKKMKNFSFKWTLADRTASLAWI